MDSIIQLAGFGFSPLILAWFWTTRCHVSNWLLERRTAAARVRLTLYLGTPWVLMAAGLMSYRVFEIPNVGVELPTHEQLLTLDSDERQTAEIYQSVAISLGINLTSLTESYVRKPPYNEAEQEMQEIEQRLQQSPEILERILVATRRPVGAFAGEPDRQNAVAFLMVRILTRVMNQSFKMRNIDRGIEFVDAQRRLLIHWRRNTNFEGLKHCTFLEGGDSGLIQSVMSQLRTGSWQTDQYRELARRMSDCNAIYQLDGPRAWQREYREAIDRLKGDNWPKHLSKDRRDNLSKRRWLLWIPGERARAIRLLKFEFAPGKIAAERFMSLQQALRSTPWASVFYEDIGERSWHRGFDTSLPGKWQTLQAWLEMQIAKGESGDWPASGEGIRGLGAVVGPGNFGGGWVMYFPKGLWSGRAPESLQVRGIEHRPLWLTGDEPCLVFFKDGLPIEPNVYDFLKTVDSDARKRKLGGLIVEPLDPLPPNPQSPTR